MDIFRGFNLSGFDAEVSGWVFWPVIIAAVAILGQLAIAIR